MYGTKLPFLLEKEKDLCKNLGLKIISDAYKQLEGPIIAIGGYSGVGKDTLANHLKLLLKKRFHIDLNTIGAGTIMRKFATEHGYSQAYLHEFTQKDKEFSRKVDHYIDERTLSEALTMQKGIFIGRMAPFVIGDWGFSIWVKTELEVNAERIIKDPHREEYGMNFEQVLESLKKRDITDRERLEQNYRIKIDHLIPTVNLILDNSDKNIEDTVEIAYNKIKNFYNLTDKIQ
ncbi:MAG: (d)CMP kinase, partial [Candidatus Thorarchaeota archaeon]